MYFEGKELKPYAEPVVASELNKDSIYYAVDFIDADMFIPNMKTLIFLGKNLDDDDGESFYFQDIDSYQQGVRYNNPTPNAFFIECRENELNNIFEYGKALDVLLRCFQRRQLKKG